MALNAVHSLKGGRARLLPSLFLRDNQGVRLGRRLALPSHGIFQGGVAATLICLLFFGCDGRQSDAQRIEKAYKSAGMEPAKAYPLGGKVTVDGQPPAPSETTPLVAIAYDAAKPDVKARSNARAFLKPDGSFELPPLPPGKYVMLFAQLRRNPKMGFFGPDGLNNLYNDPDVNSNKPELVIEHQAPGKTDYTFNLSVAGVSPPPAPGPKAFVGSGPHHN